MKLQRLLATIFLCLIGSLVFGQKLDSLKLLLKNKDYLKVEDFLNATIEYDTASNYTYDVLIKRNIIESYSEVLFWFTDNVQNDVLFACYEAKLMIFENKIIYCELSIAFEKGRKLVRFEDKKEVLKFKNDYKMIYNREVSLKEICTYVFYGNKCKPRDLNHAKPFDPEEFTLLNKYVQEKNFVKLNAWLSSPEAELQVYAIDGFYQLKESGYKLTEQELKLIKIVKAKKVKVRTCFVNKEGDQPIEDVTKAFDFKNVLK